MIKINPWFFLPLVGHAQLLLPHSTLHKISLFQSRAQHCGGSAAATKTQNTCEESREYISVSPACNSLAQLRALRQISRGFIAAAL